MNLTCKDREHVFLDGTPEEWQALESHAANCEACAEEIRAWKRLSEAAAEMRDYSENPALWSRIEAKLTEHVPVNRNEPGFWRSLAAVWERFTLGWQVAAAAALAVALAVSGGYLYQHRAAGVNNSAGVLLKDKALAEVERTEQEYIKAIDKMAEQAKPQMESPTTPLMASYQEKLMVLDSAIADLREQTGQNPSNAHLRRQLLAMYQEKQETLQEILETKR